MKSASTVRRGVDRKLDDHRCAERDADDAAEGETADRRHLHMPAHDQHPAGIGADLDEAVHGNDDRGRQQARERGQHQDAAAEAECGGQKRSRETHGQQDRPGGGCDLGRQQCREGRQRPTRASCPGG